MLQTDDLCLCSGTFPNAGYRELLSAVSKAGFKGLSLWPAHYETALSEGLSVADMALMLDDYGLQLSEFDALITLLPGDNYDKPDIPMYKYDADFFLDFASQLAARSINVVQFYGPSTPYEEAGGLFSGFCDRAAKHDLLVSLEFLPWSGIPDLASAAKIIEVAGADNGGINLDTWHFHRSGAVPEDLRVLPKGSVVTMQINDAVAEPWDDVLAETMQARAFPGEGVINVKTILTELRNMACTAPVSIEVFNRNFAEMSVEQAVQLLGDKLRSFIAGT
jgi:sugar phosphate isomerase/epimerase